MVEDGRETSFVPYVHFLFTCVKDEVGILFVEGIVGEMHTGGFQVLVFWILIRLCGESNKTLLIDIYSKRITAKEKNIDPEIEFKFID